MDESAQRGDPRGIISILRGHARKSYHARRYYPALFGIAFVAAVAALALVFHGGLFANPGSRVLGVLAIVEEGSLRADRWFGLTIDQAIVNRHVYSEKAPVPTFLIVPLYALWRLFEHRPYTSADIDVVIGLGNVFAAAVPLGVFALFLQRRAARGVSPSESVWIALLATLGTPFLSYGGTYFGEVLAGLFFVFAWHLATRDAEHHAALAGAFGGLAVLSEYQLVFGVAVLGAYLATRPSGLKLGLRYVAGGAPFALFICAYNAHITGSPFDFLYNHLTSIFWVPRLYALDMTVFPRAQALLFSQYRGLFFYAPALLVLAPLALLRAASSARRRLLVAFCVVHFVYVCSYWYWDNGWSIGPRYLTPILAILLYEGVEALAKSSPNARMAFVGLASIGVAINLVAVATNPFVEWSREPFAELFWPALARGEITPHNVLNDVGLHAGRATVALWCALFLVCAILLARAAKHQGAPAPR